MKFHRHALHLEVPESDLSPETVREHGYMFCDLCGCKPTTGYAGGPSVIIRDAYGRDVTKDFLDIVELLTRLEEPK